MWLQWCVVGVGGGWGCVCFVDMTAGICGVGGGQLVPWV